MDKRILSERDICTKFITPALRNAGWDEMLQIREEVSFTKGRIIVRGKLVSRGKAKKADFVLCEQNFNDDSAYTGQNLLDDLRRAQLLPYSTVFIMVTGEATYSKVAEAAESSLDGYLLKPHKPSVLLERLLQAQRRKIFSPSGDPSERLFQFEHRGRLQPLLR